MLADFHNDVLTAKSREALLLEYKNSGDRIVCAYFKGNRTFADAYSVCKSFAENKTDNLHLAFEDFAYSENRSVWKTLLDLKPVYVTLTWNHENIFGGGAHSTWRLKHLGRELIKELNARSIAIDLAHTNERTFFEALEIADRPVCSHTCFFDITENRRNITYDQVCKLNEKGGLIGLTFYKEFITSKKTADVGDVIRHIDWFCERFPHKNLCIGTDFNGCTDLPKGFEDYSFEPLLREALENRGYARTTIDDILYNNLSTFLTTDN